MITKISTPKLIFLFIITLGLYSLLWLAQRRNEIVETYKIPLPRWQWIVLPELIIPIFAVGFGYAMGSVLPYTIAMIATILPVLVLSIAYLGISIWWFIKFGSAVERVTNGRLTALWVFLYWFFLSFGVMFVVQYYLNKAPKKTKLPEKPTQRPSTKFVTGSIIAFSTVYALATIAGAIIGFTSSITGDSTERDAQISQLSKKADLLNKQYEHCWAELEKKYPEVAPEDEAAYLEEYDACEKVRLEQNEAADKVNELMGWW